MQQREQQQRIRSGLDEVMVISDGRGLGPPGVHDHDPAAASADLLDAPRDVRRRHQAPVRCHRVGAQGQQERGPVEVGDRYQQLVPVHQVRGEVMGQLVDRGGRVTVAGPQRPCELRAGQQRGVTVRHRVAEIGRDGVVAVVHLDTQQPFRRLVERLGPGDRLPSSLRAPHRLAQPVGILVHVLERHCLGTDVSPAEGVGGVATDGEDLLAADADLHPAHGLAQVTGPVVQAFFRHGHSLRRWSMRVYGVSGSRLRRRPLVLFRLTGQPGAPWKRPSSAA